MKSRQAVVVHLAEKAPPEAQRQHPLTCLKLTSAALQLEQSQSPNIHIINNCGKLQKVHVAKSSHKHICNIRYL
jgi:hypothetical protein